MLISEQLKTKLPPVLISKLLKDNYATPDNWKKHIHVRKLDEIALIVVNTYLSASQGVCEVQIDGRYYWYSVYTKTIKNKTYLKKVVKIFT